MPGFVTEHHGAGILPGGDTMNFNHLDVPDIDHILLEVCAETGVPVKSIKGRCRGLHVVKARHIAMAAAREITQLSFPYLAKAFSVDHSTVIYAHKRAKNWATTRRICMRIGATMFDVEQTIRDIDEQCDLAIKKINERRTKVIANLLATKGSHGKGEIGA